MEQAIRGYFSTCNLGDAEAVAATCTPDAIHYFPVHRMSAAGPAPANPDRKGA